MAGYRTSPIRRSRRSAAEIETIKDAMVEALGADAPMTVRQMFYRLVGLGLIAKTEAEYKGTICRLLADLRRDGTIPYQDIADSTRWMRKPRTFDSAKDALISTARLYRQAVWRDSDQYVEVWLEKEALAGVLVEVTEEYDVPLMVTRGYPSLSFLSTAAETIKAAWWKEKRITILYLGDYDPSGLDIRRNVAGQLVNLAGLEPDDIGFVAVAVNRDQIADLGLPTRPTKTTDSRAARFGDARSVEVDAIGPADLRQMVRDEIENLLPYGALDRVRLAEESERTILERMVATMAGAA